MLSPTSFHAATLPRRCQCGHTIPDTVTYHSRCRNSAARCQRKCGLRCQRHCPDSTFAYHPSYHVTYHATYHVTYHSTPPGEDARNE